MKVDERTSDDVRTKGGGETPPCAGLASCALPEAQSTVSAESSQTGASTRNALLATDGTASEERKLVCAIPSRDGRRGNAPTKPKAQREADIPHWYALRTTYGREKKAYDYMSSKGITAFYPTNNVVKVINGKRKVVTQSLLPNIFFAYGTEEQLKSFVYDNVNLPFLRFYYRHVHVGDRIEKTPLIVPDSQMDSLKIICSADADNTIVSLTEVPKFEKGQLVRVIDGAFKGVVGRVARWQGQQRVAVVVDNLLTAVTAYVPSAFIEKII
ncbi:UpxY family transcription antiterminator [Prevotella sp.]